MKIIVGGIIEKEGKILLVQESKEKCYKKWNIPAGRLEDYESLTEGAIREIKEETGCEVQLTGILSIDYRTIENEKYIAIVFSTKLLKENIKFDTKEILDVKWYSMEDVMRSMDDKLRSKELTKHPLINLKNKNIYSLDIINFL